MCLNHPELYIPCYLCDYVVTEGSMRFDVLEPPRTSASCTLHTLYPLKRCSWRRFDARTHVKELYTPCYLCHDVVREGSRRFAALEPPRTTPCTPCFSSFTEWFDCTQPSLTTSCINQVHAGSEIIIMKILSQKQLNPQPFPLSVLDT